MCRRLMHVPTAGAFLSEARSPTSLERDAIDPRFRNGRRDCAGRRFPHSRDQLRATTARVSGHQISRPSGIRSPARNMEASSFVNGA
jgi:hypothetical protein